MMSNKTKFIEGLSKTEQLAVLIAEACRELKSDITTDQPQEAPFIIDEGEIGTVAQILWTILERIPIQYADGRAITNREEAAKIICSLLFGKPIKNWHQTVRMAFDRDSGLKFAEDIMKIAKEKKDNMR